MEDGVSNCFPPISGVFQQIPLAQRGKGLYKRMVGIAMKQLKEGNAPEAILAALESLFLQVAQPVAALVSNVVGNIGGNNRISLKPPRIVVRGNACKIPASVTSLLIYRMERVCWAQAG
ncbi:hypothetical protein GA0116948_10769 [Chitinophaga costaii]|uniref:Uncharacterized protein n=1 Tax=Chitinophaga costaii TaxID=1335309 RepID=A0A1C4E3P5_9BACT|nr:hypothetical protein [Chitinophaga costaii]PUZ24340.1 hypothetical protein DCM91_12995 [Chitinophaga costaii]SCC38214.1 hypothetical protein GA0116948_10769 [Chitinophaga costaii]